MDIHNDNKLDVVVATQGGPTISVLRGNGDGTLAARSDVAVGGNPVAGSQLSATGAPLAAALGDLDRDGDSDIVVASSSSAALTLLFNDGNGSFARGADLPTGLTPAALAIGDVDNDARPDIVVANRAANNVGVYLGCP